MSTSKCREIEKELNSILRDLTSHTNDAPSGVRPFSQPEDYETDFPPINKFPHKYEREHLSHPSVQIHDHLCNLTEEGKTHRKNMRRTEDKFHDREDNECHEHNVRKRNGQMTKPKTRTLLTNRNYIKKRQVIDRKQREDKSEFNCSNLDSINTLGNKLKDKEIHVLTADDVEDEQNTSADPSKKFKNFKLLNKEKKRRADHPKVTDDKKTQANIFWNALTEASVTKKDKMKKVTDDDVPYDEHQETAHTHKNAMLPAYHCDTETKNIESSEPSTEISSNAEKIVCNSLANPEIVVLTSVSKSDEEPFRVESATVDTGDEFITRCNKKSCSCSQDSLYCTICDFHIDNQRELLRHKKQISHEIRRKDCFRVRSLEALNPPSQFKLAAIEELLNQVYITHILSTEASEERHKLIRELREDLRNDIEEDCSFHLFGSSINGFGLKESNINIDLEVPQGISPSKMLLKSYDGLKDQEVKYGNISSDFSATFPSISFVDRRTKLSCEITLNNDASRRTCILLKQYSQLDERVRKLGTIFRIYAKICGIDQQDFCSLPPFCFPLMVIYFLQQLEPPVLPVLHEIVGEKEALTCDVSSLWMTRNKQSVAELWIDLLKFYSTTFQYKTNVVCIRQKEPLLCKDKKWTTRMLCIEDPYHTKRNVARTIANVQWFLYILECIRSTYEYFCTCRLPQDVGDVLVEVENSSNDEEESSQSVEDSSVDLFHEDQDKDLNVDSVIASIKSMDLGPRTAGICHNGRTCELYENTEYVKSKNTVMEKKPLITDFQECFSYKFEKSHLINIQSPLLFCRQCQKANHVKKDCTIDDKLPELRKLPKMTQDHKDILTELCENVFSFCRPTYKNIQQNKLLLSDLQKHIQYVFRDAQLELFGSSCNGFGFGDSDLDICLTFHNKNDEDLDQKLIIEQLTEQLIKFRRIRNILPIPTAKVPIIKFSFFGRREDERKEGDISLYNTLGQHNTRLLSTYCKIDERVQLLGYSLKFFAKKCDICDASKGSLSSYAYILMVIFYLQQLEIPVIPVLQELYDHNGKMPERYVDNWNTWFFEDVNRLPYIWGDYGKNQQCLGELWMGMILFYTEQFKMTDYVISIRQKAPLTRFEKLWNTRSIAIEDPFDHSHNLGAGVSRKMNTFILAAFRRGREMFGRIPPARRDISNLLEYFFNAKVLTGGEKPPNERGCRLCSKIGHKIKECPLRRENFRKRHNVESRNKNNTERTGNFRNQNQFIDRNPVDRQGACNSRGAYRARWNFRNSQDQHDIRTVANCNPNI